MEPSWVVVACTLEAQACILVLVEVVLACIEALVEAWACILVVGASLEEVSLGACKLDVLVVVVVLVGILVWEGHT